MHEVYTLRDSSILAISGSVKSEGSAAVFQSRENQKAQCDRSLGFSAAALGLFVVGDLSSNCGTQVVLADSGILRGGTRTDRRDMKPRGSVQECDR